MQRHRRHLIVFALAGLALAPVASRADIVFYTRPEDAGPNGAFQGGLRAANITDENLLFNKPQIDILEGLLVRGHTNQSGVSINVEADETLAAKGGQSMVEAYELKKEQKFISAATFTAADPTLDLSSLSFQIDAKDSSTGSFTLTVLNQFGATESRTVSASSGEIFFGAIGTAGQRIESATITSTNNAIANIKQIRVGVTAVPEASSLALMGVVVTAAVARVFLRKGRNVAA